MKVYNPQAGENVGETTKKMVTLANKSKCVVQAEFNGITITARPGNKPEEVRSSYLAESNRRHEKWKKSPEGKKAAREAKEAKKLAAVEAKRKTMIFPLGDVLSVTTGRLLSTKGVDGLHGILNFMTGDNLFTHQLPRAGDECKPFLLAQFPELDTPQMQFALGELLLMLETPSGKEQPELLILGWLSKLVSGKYGGEFKETYNVKRIPRKAHKHKDPVDELAKMMGDPKKVIVVVGP